MIPKNKIRHYINGQDFGEPRNWQDLTITFDWLNRKEGVNINITDLNFVLEANRFLQQRILNGTQGGVGIFEGEPYRIEIGDVSDPVYQFDGYLDFTDEALVLGQEEISVGLKKLQGEDWINDTADGFSFAFLQDEGVITNADFTSVPYVINYIPDGTQLILLSISLYVSTKELIENTERVTSLGADVAAAAAPVVGAAGAFPVIAKDIGNLIVSSIKLAVQVAYVFAIAIAIVNLIKDLFDQLLPPKRFHLGMTFRRMFERACQYLDLQFVSSIQQLDWVHIPSKDKKGGTSGETGVPTNSGSIYTFGDLIRTCKTMFNADFRISNGVFTFERRDNFRVPSPYIIPNFFNEQDRLLDTYQFNTDEVTGNYNINFQFDSQDQNTLDDQTGRVFQAITTPVQTIDQRLVNIKGLVEVNLPFSLGKCKTELTQVEKVAKSLGRFVDTLTGIFSRGTNFAASIENRVGSLLLSSDFLSFGKLVVMQGSILARDQRALISASGLWFDFHYINSFAEVQGEHNQYFRYQGLRVPMSLQDFAKILETNLCEDQEGNPAEIEVVEYSPQLGSAVINYRVKKKYTNNLKVTYV